MNRRLSRLLFSPAFATLLATLGIALSAHGAALYAVDESTNELIFIDGDTGATQSIGTVGFPAVIALAFDTSSGVLYGISRPGSFFTADLIAINQQTGAGTFLRQVDYYPSNPGLPTGAALNLAFDPTTETLVATGGTSLSDFGFYSIDRNTGVGSLIERVSFSVAGLSFQPMTGRAFLILNNFLVAKDLFPPAPGNDTALPIANLLIFAGLDLVAFDQTEDNLFAIVVTQTTGTKLASIDATTAVLTVIGGVSAELDDVRGIELIPDTLEAPEPAVPLALCTGIAFLLSVQRRRRRSSGV